MDLNTVTQFFMWCSIINGGLLTLWVVVYMTAPQVIYKTQEKFFPVSRETFDIVYYSLVGTFKVLFIVFNLVPYIALRIIA